MLFLPPRCPLHEVFLRLSDTPGHLPLELWEVLPPLLCGVDVGGRLVVGVRQHGDDGDEDGLHRVDGQPALVGLLVAPPVVARLVKDGDANVAVLLDVGVPDVGDHLQLGRPQRVLLREGQVALEEAALV